MEESAKSKKSMSVSDLMKSVDAYDAIEDALAESGPSRESFLQAKLDAGTLTKSERIELGQIWADEDGDDNSERLSKSVVDTLSEDDEHAELVDASDFLKSLVSGIDYRMDKVETEVTRDGRATRQLLKAHGSLLKGLATVIAEQDEIIKSLGGRIEVVESTPAPRRSITTDGGAVKARDMAKSVIGGGSAEGLSKGQIKGGLRTLMMHAADSNDESAMNNITHATALFEQTGSVPENMMTAIQQVASS